MAQSKLSLVKSQHPSYDEISLNSTIPNFKALYAATKADKRRTIIQEKFSIKGNAWAFELGRYKEEDVGIFLNFYGSTCFTAEYTVYLKSSKGEFMQTINLGLHKYAPLDLDIEGASNAWGWQKWKSLSELEKEVFLKDDILDLKLIVRVYSPKEDLKLKVSQDFRKGLDSGVGANVNFIFLEDGEEGSQNVIGEIKAHGQILSLRSSVFATMFGSGMTEALKDGNVEIDDMTPRAFKILLKYIYSGELDGEWGSVAAELIYGADKYDLGELREYLCANVGAVLTVENVMKIRDLAKLQNFPQEVLESTKKFIAENLEGFLEIHNISLKD